MIASRTKLSVLVAIAAALVTLPSITAEAQRHRRGEAFSSQDTFGLGFMFGAPTGLSGKYYLSDDTALDFGVGAYRRVRFHSAFQIHADYLLHPINLVSHQDFDLPIYFGIGGRLLFREYDPDEDRDDDLHLGVRAPVGISMVFTQVPIDVFFELAMVLDLIVVGDDYFFADLNGAIGFRYYFY